MRNYKSVATCNLTLRALTFMVGPNGAGKSNVLDGLRFIADALRDSLDHALRSRGGIKEVRRRSGGHPNHFALQVHFGFPDGTSGLYGFQIGARPQGGYEVQQEFCNSVRGADPSRTDRFRVERGIVVDSSIEVPPAASADRLFLVNVSGYPEFRPLYSALSRMGFFSLNPDRIRDLQPPDAGDLLARDGGNLASVLGKLARENPTAKKRIEEYLSRVVPGIREVEPRSVGPKETLEFRQDVAGARDPWRFFAANMSDGTLRTLGVLVALFQSSDGGEDRVRLVGVEEPEIALHPASAAVLRDGLRDASRSTQVLVTSHSPDLLDDEDIEADSILAVVSEHGATRIGRLNEVGRSVLHDRLYTVGELLRMNQLDPEVAEQEFDLSAPHPVE
ncbi:MAG: AAA family ATPase [Verrucomicrobiae bacterium]|nr:AAA family ATPase [Verrucomicrobiae bacterium]